MATIVLKIDVDTLTGTRKGAPHLARLLERSNIPATFLFSMGPDHTGWALRRIFRPGFLTKVSRTSVLEHYGLNTLSYGILLPGPDISRRAKTEMLAIQRAGFEIGIHTWDHVLWQDNVRWRDEYWTKDLMYKSYQRFIEIFDCLPSTHGAAGWQTNEYALHQLDAWKIHYASDGRGQAPYYPSVNGQKLHHVQIPTTLPTLDELLGVENLNVTNVADYLLAQTEHSNTDHVFTLHAELEGQKLSFVFESLLKGWTAQGHSFASMNDYYKTLNLATLPTYPFSWGKVPGRSGELMVCPPSSLRAHHPTKSMGKY